MGREREISIFKKHKERGRGKGTDSPTRAAVRHPPGVPREPGVLLGRDTVVGNAVHGWWRRGADPGHVEPVIVRVGGLKVRQGNGGAWRGAVGSPSRGRISDAD